MQRPGRHVVRFVVLIVVARGDAWVIGTGVASGPVLFHVTPSFLGARLAAGEVAAIDYRAIDDSGNRSDALFEVSVSRDQRWVDRARSADVRGRSVSGVTFCGGVR
jgi:hypothetical protein